MKKKIGIIVSIVIVVMLIVGIISWKIFSHPQEEISNEEQNQTEEEQIQKDILVEYNMSGTWQDGDSTALKYDVKVINNSSEDIENWSIVFDVNASTKVSQFWNGKLELSDSKLTVTPEQYNNLVSANSQVELGFILTDSEQEAIKGYKLYIDGKEYIGAEKNVEETEVEETTEPVRTPSNQEGTPVSVHGKLSVKGKNIVDKDGNTFIIQGVSTHGIAWFPKYVSLETFKTLRDDFNANTIRLAMYSDKNAGYHESMHAKVSEGVDYATELGMYVIIDWHILGDNNPNQNKEAAKKFFTEMTNKYKDYDNVIYEICNEPNGNVTWSKDVKTYANEIIPLIRSIDDDAIIVVGTPTWSQDVDIASKDQLEGYSNIVYTLHFYASTHKQDLRNKLKTALDNGLPVLVSEFGICDASGNGSIDENEANKWISYLRENGIGYVCWNLSNKNESSSILKSSTTSISGWSDSELSQEGLWLKKTYNN